MIDLNFVQIRLYRIYRSQKSNLYSNRLYRDLCSGFSFVLGDPKVKGFFSFEPEGCTIEKLFSQKKYGHLEYEIERILESALDSMLRYGKAYLYLNPEYTTIKNEDSSETVISGIELGEMKGCPGRKKNNKTIFYVEHFGGDIEKIELVSNGIIELNLKDLGYKKNFFSKMVKRLGKFDTTSIATDFMLNSVEGYDFVEHNKNNQIKILKSTKHIGWYFTTEELSDSYILYKKIQQNKLKIKFINYMIDKINIALKALLADQNIGEIRVHIQNIDYDQLWDKYSNGKITGSELTRVLYHR